MKKIIIISTVPLSFATLIKGQAKFLSQYYNVKMVTSHSEANESIALNEGVDITSIDITRKITPFKDIVSLSKIFFYLLKEKPDMVYSFTPKAGLLGMIAAFFARVPVRIHNIVGMPLMEAQGMKRKLLMLIEKLTYLFSTKLLCNSFGLKTFISENLTSKDVSVIANGSINGVDTSYFENKYSDEQKNSIKAQYGLDPDSYILTYVGRIVKDKGINELIEVFPRLKLKRPNLKLLLVGDYEASLNPIDIENYNYIQSCDDIITVGFQKDIREFLAISDIFVLPSYREGLPNSLIEAGSYGIPLISTDINGCNEIIINGETGLLVNKKDAESLQNGIEQLISDEKLYQHIKNKVRKSTIERYDQQYFWTELKKEIDNSFTS